MTQRLLDRPVAGTSWHITTSKGIDLTIRVAGKADEADMRQFCDTLDHKVLSHRFDTGSVNSYALNQIVNNRTGVTLMAMRDGKLVGFAEYRDSPQKNSPLRTCQVALLVHQDHHKQGIGTTLNNEVMRIAKENGFQRIEWAMLLRNKAMIEMIKKMDLSLQRCPDDSGYLMAVLAEKPAVPAD